MNNWREVAIAAYKNETAHKQECARIEAENEQNKRLAEFKEQLEKLGIFGFNPRNVQNIVYQAYSIFATGTGPGVIVNRTEGWVYLLEPHLGLQLKYVSDFRQSGERIYGMVRCPACGVIHTWERSLRNQSDLGAFLIEEFRCNTCYRTFNTKGEIIAAPRFISQKIEALIAEHGSPPPLVVIKE